MSHRPGHYHAVRFYQNKKDLAVIVGEFLLDGISDGQPAVVIATPNHRLLIGHELTVHGVDTDAVEADGKLLMLDAEQTLTQFMVDGMPHPTRFRHTIVPVIDAACRNRAGCPVRAFGEMVDVLWQRRQQVAAMRLEMLWNDLARTHDFSLLCGYSPGNVYTAADRREILSEHSHAVAEGGDATRIA